MSQKKILFRADGNSRIGLGHLYRLFALIEIYKDQYEYIVLTKEESAHSIIPEEYPRAVIPEEINIREEPQWLHRNYSPEKHIIIADGYQFDTSYQKEVKALGFFLMYIDDLLSEATTADIVVNHSENIRPSDYVHHRIDMFALGAQYAILRPSFLNVSKSAIQKKESIQSAFVCFGGADPNNLTLKVVKGLLTIGQIKRINVVLGGAYMHNEIYALDILHEKIVIHKNLNESALFELMQSCGVAIAPASTILYELCSIGIPVLSGYFVENQINMYRALAEKGVVYKGGDFNTYTIEDFKEKIQELLNKKDHREVLNKQRKIFDGTSGKRLTKVLNEAFLTLRNATLDDIQKTYEWSNEELVRQNSFHSESIPFEEHQEWFLNKLKDEKTLFLIGQFFGTDAAVIRMEKQAEYTVIGISVSKEFRGKKLATSFLIKSAKYYFKQNSLPILAYIKLGNIPSIRSFEGAGFKRYKEDIHLGIPSVVYKLTNHDLV